MSARTELLNFPLPRGVTEAEQKRELAILAEVTAQETRIVEESRTGLFHVVFTDPYRTLDEVCEVVRRLEAKGYDIGDPQWTRDKSGIINGIRFTELTGAL